jgi:MFS family permease
MTSPSHVMSQDEISIKERTPKAPIEYPTRGRRTIILTCLILGTFLVAVDTTIISVAIPRISTDFRALDNVGWYGSAYLMTLTAFQPTMGKVYKMFSPKAAYLVCMVVFEGMCIIL